MTTKTEKECMSDFLDLFVMFEKAITSKNFRGPPIPKSERISLFGIYLSNWQVEPKGL